MPHLAAVPSERKKIKPKLERIAIRILDDGTFIYETMWNDFEKNKEFSAANMDEIVRFLKQDLKGKNIAQRNG